MQRAFDSLIHDVALQNAPVLFLLDRAGLVGEDGPTHHGTFDISYTRLIPNVEIWTPLDGQDLANMVYTSIIQGLKKPRFIRFPRDGEKVSVTEIIENLRIVNGEWRFLKKSESDIYVLAVGTMSQYVFKALNEFEVNIIGVRSVKPVDNFVMQILIEKANYILVYEEGSLKGGFNEEIYKLKNKQIFSFGIKDDFISHGTREEQLKECRLDTDSIKMDFEELLLKINNSTKILKRR